MKAERGAVNAATPDKCIDPSLFSQWKKKGWFLVFPPIRFSFPPFLCPHSSFDLIKLSAPSLLCCFRCFNSHPPSLWAFFFPSSLFDLSFSLYNSLHSYPYTNFLSFPTCTIYCSFSIRSYPPLPPLAASPPLIPSSMSQGIMVN